MLAEREKVHCCEHSVGCWLKKHSSSKALIVQKYCNYTSYLGVSECLCCYLRKAVDCWQTHQTVDS
jgi:hypothetical protein